MHVKLFAEHAVNYFFHLILSQKKKKISTFINLLNLKLIFKTHLLSNLNLRSTQKLGEMLKSWRMESA